MPRRSPHHSAAIDVHADIVGLFHLPAQAAAAPGALFYLSESQSIRAAG
jgi:hypothetical protein